MAYSYDPDNVFARILRGEIPNRTVLETEHTLAFEDIAPQAPHHVLVIIDFNRTVARICMMLDIAPGDGRDGYRLIANAGRDGVQDVPHFHLHILGGRVLGRMLPKG